ncbi:MAG: sulfatase-like hydrolase/transferase, partial [Deltaproteobacteria bacterium]|nr:sulfatase-like hydrolase/transferase [Deltaproteobacteria bacterium]
MALVSLLLCIGQGCGRDASIDLIARAESAEVQHEVRRIDIGTPSALPHLSAGWGPEERWGDASFAWALGRSSTVDFFVGTPRPLRLTLRGWPLPFGGLPPQTVALTLNDVPLGTLTLRPGEREYQLDVPTTAQRSGTNRLRFTHGVAPRPRDLDPASHDARQLAAGWDWLAFDGLDDGEGLAVEGGALRLPPVGEVSFYLDVPPGAALEMDHVAASGGGAPAPLLIEAQRDDGGTVAVAELAIATSLGTQRWPLDRGVTRLRFRTADAARRIALTGVRLRVPRPSAAPVACADAPARATAPAPPVIVYLIDTLRADHLGCYGYPLPTSPRIDAFAADAVRFAHTVAQSSWTKPSVASLFTGLTPKRHGAIHAGDVLAAVPTLAGLLAAAGYETAAVVTNSVVGRHTGFDQGFTYFESLPEQPVAPQPGLTDFAGEVDHQSAAVLNQRALAWLDQRRDAPFLLYLHASDPHSPYLPAAAFRQQFAPGVDATLGLKRHLQALASGAVASTADERRKLMALYDAEIASVDQQFGILLDALRARDLYDAAVIVLVADHGEAFDEHGRWEHASSLFAEQLDVPLLIKFPRQWRAGSVVHEVAQLVDVLPTILRSAGVAIPDDLTGADLVPLAGCPELPRPARIAYSALEGLNDSPQIEALTVGRQKLIHSRRIDLPQPRVALYALDRDPGERDDLSDRLPVT